MKVFFPCAGQKRYNDHLHVDFFLKAFRDHGFEVVVYGPKAHLRGGSAPIEFDSERSIDSVVKALNPDLYFTMVPRRNTWCTHHKITLDIPKVMYEPDFHYAEDGSHYHGGELLIVRASNAVKHAQSLPGGGDIKRIEWLPFSFDETKIPKHADPDSPLVAFAGADQHAPYPVRAEALDALSKASLLDRHQGYFNLNSYFYFLSTHRFGLTCSSKWHLEHAKHVEIPACGAILLADNLAPGLNYLLERSMYLVYEPSNVAQLVREALAVPNEMRDLAIRAKAHVFAHHTDTIRGAQFIRAVREAIS